MPDFVANPGEVIWVHGQRSGWDDVTTNAAIYGIGGRFPALIERARTDGSIPVDAGRAQAREILAAARVKGESQPLAATGSETR